MRGVLLWRYCVGRMDHHKGLYGVFGWCVVCLIFFVTKKNKPKLT